MPALKKILWAAAIFGVGSRLVGRRGPAAARVDLIARLSSADGRAEWSEYVNEPGEVAVTLGNASGAPSNNHATIVSPLPLDIVIETGSEFRVDVVKLDGAALRKSGARQTIRIDDIAGGVVSIEAQLFDKVSTGGSVYAGPLFISVVLPS